MAKEDQIQQEIVKQFPSLEGKIRFQRPRRLWAMVDEKDFIEVLEYLRKMQECTILTTMTGLDKGEMLAVIYHLARPDGIMLNVEIQVPRSNPTIKTVTYCFPSADLYERELIDLLGFKIDGLAQGFRYPLTDDWPEGEHPLRKDWKKDSGVQTETIKEG